MRPALARIHVVAALVATLLGVCVVARAQSLGDAAAKEKQRREAEKKKSPAPAYSDEDLKKGAAPKAKEGDASAPASGSAARKSEGSGRESSRGSESGQSEAAWRGRGEVRSRARTEAAQAVADVQARMDLIRQKLNPQSRNFVVGTNEQLALQKDLTNAEAALEAAKKAVADADREWAALEEEARKAGVPHSWLEAGR
jgi:hypothetical protein